MLSRISDAIHLQMLSLGEWINERLERLSPGGKRILLAMLIALFVLAARYGLLPSKHTHYNPHALFSW